MQVETMIKQHKTDADSIHKINTLKSILAMLDKPEDKRKTDEKCKTKMKSSETDKDLKHDEQISSDLKKDEQLSSDLKQDEQLSSDLKQDEQLSSDLTQDEKISGEDIKTENVILKIQVEDPDSSDESTNDVIVKKETDTLNENVKFEQQKNKVSFAETRSCIETMVKLDESLHDKNTDDIICVDKLVIDDNQVLDYSLPVDDTGQDIEKAVAGVIGDLLDNVVAEVEADGEDLSSTPPCSQIPQEDPYAQRCEVKEDSQDIR